MSWTFRRPSNYVHRKKKKVGVFPTSGTIFGNSSLKVVSTLFPRYNLTLSGKSNLVETSSITIVGHRKAAGLLLFGQTTNFNATSRLRAAGVVDFTNIITSSALGNLKLSGKILLPENVSLFGTPLRIKHPSLNLGVNTTISGVFTRERSGKFVLVSNSNFAAAPRLILSGKAGIQYITSLNPVGYVLAGGIGFLACEATLIGFGDVGSQASIYIPINMIADSIFDIELFMRTS